jgi:hypothetical protein
MVGCSGSKSSSTAGSGSTFATGPSSAASSTSTSVPKGLTDAELKKLLLSVQDMPTGFSVDNSPRNDQTQTKLCGQVSINQLVPHTGQATIVFLGGQIGPALAEELTSYRGSGDAKNAMSKARSEVGSCTKFDQTDSKGAVTHWTLGELSFPKLAGDQMALRLSGEFQGGLGTVDLVLARESGIIVLVGGISATTILGGGQLQPGQLESTVRKAVDKVHAGT